MKFKLATSNIKVMSHQSRRRFGSLTSSCMRCDIAGCHVGWSRWLAVLEAGRAVKINPDIPFYGRVYLAQMCVFFIL